MTTARVSRRLMTRTNVRGACVDGVSARGSAPRAWRKRSHARCRARARRTGRRRREARAARRARSRFPARVGTETTVYDSSFAFSALRSGPHGRSVISDEQAVVALVSSSSSRRARLVSSPSLVFFWPRRAIVCVFTSTCFPVSWVGSPPTRASPPPRLCFPSCASRPRRDPRVSPLASAPPPSPAPVSSATPRRAARPAREPCSEVLPDARCTPWERVRGPTRRAIVRRRWARPRERNRIHDEG